MTNKINNFYEDALVPGTLFYYEYWKLDIQNAMFSIILSVTDNKVVLLRNIQGESHFNDILHIPKKSFKGFMDIMSLKVV